MQAWAHSEEQQKEVMGLQPEPGAFRKGMADYRRLIAGLCFSGGEIPLIVDNHQKSVRHKTLPLS